jgi:hypothetical protein
MKKGIHGFKKLAIETVARRTGTKSLVIQELPSVDVQQNIINLLILNLPFAPILIKEDREGVWTVCHNNHIVSTINAFVKNEIKHNETSCLFDELPNITTNSIRDFELYFTRLTPDIPTEIQDKIIKEYQSC